LSPKEIKGKHLRETIDKSGCCGALELLKICAWRLEDYYRVLLLDMDAVLVKNLDHLFEDDQEKDLKFTWDNAMDSGNSRAPPVQGGFLMIKPSQRVFEQIIDVVREGDFRPGTGWGGTRIGWCWGGQTVQGLLAYYYSMVEPDKGLAIDPCRYNSMATTKECKDYPWEQVASIHYTYCQKPWKCHRTEGICEPMHNFWWKTRQNLEEAQGIPKTERCCCSSRHYSKLPLSSLPSPVWSE